MSAPLMTTEEVAHHLKVPVPTLYRWRQINYGPTAIRVGKHLRYRAAEVEKWINEQGAQAGSAA